MTEEDAMGIVRRKHRYAFESCSGRIWKSSKGGRECAWEKDGEAYLGENWKHAAKLLITNVQPRPND